MTAAPRPPFSWRSRRSTRPGWRAMASRTASAVPSGLPSSATQTSIVSPIGEELVDQGPDVLALVVGGHDHEGAAGAQGEPPAVRETGIVSRIRSTMTPRSRVSASPGHTFAGRKVGDVEPQHRRPGRQRIGQAQPVLLPFAAGLEPAHGRAPEETETGTGAVAGRRPVAAVSDDLVARARAGQIHGRAGARPAVGVVPAAFLVEEAGDLDVVGAADVDLAQRRHLEILGRHDARDLEVERARLRSLRLARVGALPLVGAEAHVLDVLQEQAAEVRAVGVDEVDVAVAAAPGVDQVLRGARGRGSKRASSSALTPCTAQSGRESRCTLRVCSKITTSSGPKRGPGRRRSAPSSSSRGSGASGQGVAQEERRRGAGEEAGERRARRGRARQSATSATAARASSEGRITGMKRRSAK